MSKIQDNPAKLPKKFANEVRNFNHLFIFRNYSSHQKNDALKYI